jgi:hypothetical protein
VLKIFVSALTSALSALLGSWTIAAANPACDYSFIVRQPIFRLVAPQESGVDVSLATPLGISTESGDFGRITQVKLLPDSGAALVLSPKFKPLPTGSSGRSRRFESPATIVATMSMPQLRPSTTYDVVFSVRTLNAPARCPKQMTEHIARFTTESATSLDAIALAHEAAAGPPPAGKLSGGQIFENALHTLRTLEYPPVVAFLITVHSTVGGKPFVESFRSSVRTSDGLVTTHAVPVSTTNQPENPWGWRIQIPILSSLFPNQRKGNYSQPFGVPMISPTYAFGLLPRRAIEFPGTRTNDADPNIKSLGRVLSIARNYDASLIGIEQYRSRFVYHLKLSPLDRPDFYRLRELWIDTQAFVIWKLRSAGIFDSGAATTVPWDIEYTIADGHWLMANESTASTIRTGGFLANTPAVNYDGVSYTLSDFTFPVDTLDLDFFSEVRTEAIQE